MPQINTLMQKTEQILAKYKRARNDDKYLCIVFWWEYHRGILEMDANNKNPKILLENILQLPSQDFISRCRRKIQESGKYLPTDWEVARKRKINEDVWKNYMLGN